MCQKFVEVNNLKLLKDKILNEGKVIDGKILKVDSFLNHQMDVRLFNEIGKEFRERFSNDVVTKIVTIEASGIGIACMAAEHFGNVPVVFAKKTLGANIVDETYSSDVHSFTKNQCYKVKIAKRFIDNSDKVLIIDDFLANGCAALGLIDIVRQAGAEVVGVGIVIEKGFQPGRKVVEEAGVRVESLAIIEKFDNDRVIFKE